MICATDLFFLLLSLTIALAPIGVKVVIGAGSALLALVSAWMIYQTRRHLPTLPYFLMMICGGISLATAASALWSADPFTAITGAGKATAIMAGGILITMGAERLEKTRVRAWSLALPCAASMALFLLALFMASDLSALTAIKGGAERLADLNKPLGVLVLMGPALLYPLLSRGQIGWGIGASAVILFAWILSKSESQGAGLALILMIGAAFLPARDTVFARAVFRVVRLMIIIGVLSAPFAVQFLFTHIADKVGTDGILRAANTAQRLEVWNGLAGKILERPIFGYGYDAARHIGIYDTKQIYQKSNTILHPHNLALQLWLEFGFIGAFLGAAALATMLRRIEKITLPSYRRLGTMMYAGTLGIALVSWGMWQVWWMVLIFILIALFVMVRPDPRLPNMP